MKSVNLYPFLFLFYLLFPVTAYSQANNKIPKEVETVLKKAGKNKLELIKAINHFKKSSNALKLKAVYFLISNMDIHYSVDTYLKDAKGKKYPFDEFKYSSLSESQKALADIKKKYSLRSVSSKILDVNVISSKFLINNIEYAFSVKDASFGKYLKFEDFCEYILPYRVSTEPLSDWRVAYKKRFSFLSNSTQKDSKGLAFTFANDFRTWFTNTYGSEGRAVIPRLGAQQLLFYKKGPCEDISDLVGFAFRSQGIPVALDEVTCWATSSGKHYFNTIFDAKMNPFPVYDVSTKTFTNTPLQREPAKVIRWTFSKQPNIIAKLIPVNQIPPGFMRKQNFTDVTASYWKTKDVSTPLIKKKSNQPKFAFISIFNELRWKPTWWARVKGDSTRFKSMCQGAVFLPQYYINGKLESAGYPIVSGYSRQVILKPDIKSKRNIRIFPKDKYLVFHQGWNYMLHFWGKNGWERIGSNLVKDPSIKYMEFKGVPANSLLLLLPEHSVSLERPFTIADDGTQQWW